MSNEALDTINRYFCNTENTMHFLGNKIDAQEVADFLSKGEIFTGDVPDMAILYNSCCLAIEHFEFDNYKNGRSGSTNRKEQARIERTFRFSVPSTQEALIYDEIRGKSSYELYIKNITTVFNEHYNRIAHYRHNLIEKGLVNSITPLKLAFLIEDVSPLGAMTYNDDGPQPIVLALSKEFLKLMRKSPNVDYVIACSSVGLENYIWFIIERRWMNMSEVASIMLI